MKQNPLLIPIVTIALSLAALPAAAQSPAADEAAPGLETARAKAVATFNEVRPEHVQPSPVPGWYTIRKGTLIAYISGDGKYLFQGDLIDIDDEISLTEVARNEARLEMMEAVPEERTIVFAPDEVKHVLSVFTDVDCTYCRRFHSQIDEYLEQGIEVRYLLYPRNGPESESWTTAERVWCAADRKEALTLAKLDREFESKTCDASIIHDHYALGQEVGLRGTPALVLEDGTLISGYVPPVELSQRMTAAAE
ncbi:MAG TPA: DsbC family protein [Woeseiaceae bacterium]|nr:DsbC family protein [Woeseiaceae bacterium]